MLPFYLSLIGSEEGKCRFEEIYYTYRRQMFALANSILRNEHDAEDAVHDVFYAVASSHMDVITETEDERDIRNYLLKSVKNACVTVMRKRKVRFEHENYAADPAELSDAQFLDEVCTRLKCADVIAAMDSLDDKYREVLYYHFVLDLTIAETAALLGRNANTVHKQLVRGKSLLFAAIDCKGGGCFVDD